MGWWAGAYDWWGDRSQQWGSKQSQPSQPSQLPALASLLQRGHTVDQLQDWELQQIVADIDRLQNEKKNKTSDDKANSKAAEGEREQAQPTKKQKQDGDAKDDDTKGTAIEKEEANEEDPATKAQQAKEQAKEERRKRLHARNMRFYRSLSSYFDAFAKFISAFIFHENDVAS